MATERKILSLQIDADPRLAAAAGGVMRYLADAVGLESDTVAKLQSAVIAACSEAFENLTGTRAPLDISFVRLSDRFEVALSHRGSASPAIGLDTIAGFAPEVRGAAPHSGIFAVFDRVQYEKRGGDSVTRLTKYITPAESRA